MRGALERAIVVPRDPHHHAPGNASAQKADTAQVTPTLLLFAVEHFRELVAPLLNGRGKAMVAVAAARRPFDGNWPATGPVATGQPMLRLESAN